MILSSSLDYGTKTVTLEWENEVTESEFIEYTNKNYGGSWEIFDIEKPSSFKGMNNPGIVVLKFK